MSSVNFSQGPSFNELKRQPARDGVFARVLRDPVALLALVVLGTLVIGTLAAPWLVSGSPLKINPSARFTPPNMEFLFGTDNIGRNVFNMVLYGGRTSLLVGFSVMLLSMTIAVFLGVISGFFHRVDVFLMRLVDGLMAFPGIVLAIAVAGIMGPSSMTVIVSLTIVFIAPSLRIIRGQVLMVRELQMIEAARAVGVPVRRILRCYVLPAVISHILVQATFIFSAAVLGEATLSFIGVGVGPKELSWGSALTESRHYIAQAPWVILFPGACLMLTILSLNLLGDSLRDILDPTLAHRRR